MRLGIHSNTNRDKDYEIALASAKEILRFGAVPVFADELRDNDILSSIDGIEFGSFVGCEVIISIGGDGTLLSVVSKYRELDIPFVGINRGSIGFLTEIDVDNISESIERIINGSYSIVERSQLLCTVYDKNKIQKAEYVCLNDCVVTRGATLNIVKMDLLIDDQYVERFAGDGIIVSTPTGSTAYSLAAGGPILMPAMKNIIVTPLCPHTLQSASYCIDDKSYIEIQLEDFESAPVLSPDGKQGVALEPRDTIYIKTYDSPIKMIMMGYSGFFQTVRSKITARGSFYEHKK